VFGDDCVIHYTGVDDVAGGVGEVECQRGAAWEFYFMVYIYNFL